MPEHDEDRQLNMLLAALKEHGWECIADEADRSLIAIDANGEPHECWDGYDAVNVCVPMSVDEAVRYFSDPRELDRLRTENAKLRELLGDALKTLFYKRFDGSAGCTENCPRWQFGKDCQLVDGCWLELEAAKLGVVVD